MVILAALLAARFRTGDTSLLPDDGAVAERLQIPEGVNMGRRRSRAVLYQLSGHYKPEKMKTKMKLNSVSIPDEAGLSGAKPPCW